MARDPVKLFKNTVEDWNLKQNHSKSIEELENILLLLGHGEYDDSEDENPDVGVNVEDGEYFDNLTQKVYAWKGELFFIQGLFKEGMLAFDEASQINQENTTPQIWRIKSLQFYIDNKRRSGDRKQTGYDQDYPELSKELIKVCDKLLSIDKKNLGALVTKTFELLKIHRYEEALECSEMKLKLFQECDDIVDVFTGKKAGANDKQLQAWKEKHMLINLHTKASCYFWMTKPLEEKRCLLEILKIDPYDEVALKNLHEAEINGSALGDSANKNDLENKKETSAFCDNCGKSLRPTAKFCGSCGTSVP